MDRVGCEWSDKVKKFADVIKEWPNRKCGLYGREFSVGPSLYYASAIFRWIFRLI